MRVLLLSIPFVTDYMRNARCDYVSLSAAQYYPLWLSYCGALLEKYGHDVKLIDGPAEDLTKEEAMTLAQDFNPAWTVVYSSTRSQESDIAFSQKLKKKTGSKIVFVGPFVSINPQEILEKSPEVDCAVIREFDYPVLEIVQDEPFQKIKNLFWRKNKTIKQNEARPLLTTKELDEIPFVAKFYKNHLNIKNYHIPQQLYPFVDILTGRGCAWGRCTFCLWVHTFIPGPNYNMRSLENVIEEIKFIKKEMPEVKEIFFQDDILVKERAIALSQAIIAQNLQIPWTCYSKGGSYDLETLKLMKQAGCRNIHVGYESANMDVLRNIRKGAHVAIYEQFTADAHKAGVDIHGDFIMGLPGETKETAKETINWAKKQKGITTAQFEIANTYKTLPLYEQLKTEGNLVDDEPSYPHLNKEEIRKIAKIAFLKFYLRPKYFKKLLQNPRAWLIGNFKSIIVVLTSIFFKRWQMGGAWVKFTTDKKSPNLILKNFLKRLAYGKNS